MLKHKGVILNLGGVDYTFPPMALGTLEQLRERIADFNGNVFDSAQVSTVIDAAQASLVRNYPEITREQVADLVDVGNIADVFGAIMDVSGLKRKAQEAEASGEAQAG